MLASRVLRDLLLSGAAACALATAAVILPAAPAAARQQAQPPAARQVGTLIPAEVYELENGLTVIFHIDRSDPVVAVNLTAHVGSGRELPGRTGFAHLFEHLFFLDSENLGPGGLDRLSARVGGSGANGSTSNDRTDYLQTVPNNALEKMIWAEADKLGYFINTVTPAVVAKEIQVVKNEKRQSYDNRPYGHTYPVVMDALFPDGHPYSWPVIGSLADLDAATLEDVQAFYRRWYTPNNTTLVIAGDFDPAQAREWVQKYFGEIPRGPEAERPAVQGASLSATRRLMHEDNFAQLPELNLWWPAVEEGHPDEPALEMLLTLLTDGKEAPLNAVLVDEEKVTAEVGGGLQAMQLAGAAALSVRAFEGTDLDRVQAALDQGFARFESQGVDEAALGRAKTMAEARLYSGLNSVLGKSAILAENHALLDNPAFLDTDLQRLRAVTAEDVMRVYQTYIKDRPHVATSFVPKGKPELALENSEVAEVVEEAIVQGAEAPIDASVGRSEIARTASSFDRSVEPPAGPDPVIAPPATWTVTTANGLQVMGIENNEAPLAAFQLSIEGGRLFDDPARPGAANMLARMMTRGAQTRTPAELENAFKALGATVNVRAEDERFVISGTTLARNFDATLDLVEEMLFQPRWDAEELALAKAAVTSQIQDQRAQPNALASRVYDLVAYGDGHILSRNALGTERSIAGLEMADLQSLMAWAIGPRGAHFRVVGDVDRAAVAVALTDLGSRWQTQSAEAPAQPQIARPERAGIYFYDVPGAKQSVLTFGYPALRRADRDYFPASVMNFRLGGGGFASDLTQQLRETHGYTYGVRTVFSGGRTIGHFALSSGVRSNVTLEASQLARDIMRDFGPTFDDEDLAVTRSALGNGRARAFETPGAKLGVLEAIGEYGLPTDYLARESAIIDEMTVDQIKALADRYVRPDEMIYVVVGDAATQAQRLEALGYGPPVMMNAPLAAADQ